MRSRDHTRSKEKQDNTPPRTGPREKDGNRAGGKTIDSRRREGRESKRERERRGEERQAELDHEGERAGGFSEQLM